MNKGRNRYNHRNNRNLTPRQRQMIVRKINLLLSTIIIAVILSVFVGGLCNTAKAADNYTKYYTSIQVQPGDTLSDYYEIYGEHYKSCDKYIQEVCMINSIEADRLTSGYYIVIPYYSDEVK